MEKTRARPRRPTLRQRQLDLHRWLGLAAAVALLLFGLSGVLHIAMSRLQPPIAAFAPPAAPLPPDGLSLAAVLNRHGMDSIASARTVAIGKRTYYRVRASSGTRHYFNVRDGNRLPDGERRHAESLARHFSGEKSAPLAATLLVHRFDSDYLPVNRLLPVWRIGFGRPDGLAVYVDTEGDRLATLMDARKRTLQGLFRQLHTFAWLEEYRWPRLVLMLAMLAATGAAAAVGISLWWQRRPRAAVAPLRRWHHRAGLVVVITTLAFVISGSWRLLHGIGAPIARPSAPEPSWRSAALTYVPVGTTFALLDTPLGACYLERSGMDRAGTAPHQHAHTPAQRSAPETDCLDVTTGAVLPGAERAQAIRLAQHYAGSTASASEAHPVNQFGAGYGFINKRLPVWRVVLAGDSHHWYVETTSGALALRSDAEDMLAASIFSNLHKWQFFGDDNRALRDTLQVMFVAGNLGVAGMGLVLFARRARSIKPRRTRNQKAR